MATILDLPDEIHLLIAKHLKTKIIFYSLIRVCHSFYSTYFPCLWSDLYVDPGGGKTIDATNLRINAHLVDSITFSPSLTEEYYTIDFPRLYTLRLETFYYPEGLLARQVDFMRRHPFIRKLVCQHKDPVPREFWEVIVTEWTHLEVFHFSGIVEKDAQDAFWMVCDRVQHLDLSSVDVLPNESSILTTLSFQRLQTLGVAKSPWGPNIPYRAWPLQLLEQVKMSPSLTGLQWYVSDMPFPVQRFLESLLEESSWPALCDLNINDSEWTDQDGAEMLRLLPSRRLTEYDRSGGGIFGPLTFDCMREMYFGHLRELTVRGCKGFTSAMAQEVLMECVNLVNFRAHHIFVRDIVTAPKPWGCLQLERMEIFIAKEPGGEAGWEGRVFEQIGRLRRLLYLNLQRVLFLRADEYDGRAILNPETLDLRLSCSRMKDSGTIDGVELGGEAGDGSNDRGANISCWSSLVQLQTIVFSGTLQKVGMEEALWMVEHWRNLNSVCGEFRGIRGVEGDDRDKIRSVFTDNHVILYD